MSTFLPFGFNLAKGVHALEFSIFILQSLLPGKPAHKFALVGVHDCWVECSHFVRSTSRTGNTVREVQLQLNTPVQYARLQS